MVLSTRMRRLLTDVCLHVLLRFFSLGVFPQCRFNKGNELGMFGFGLAECLSFQWRGLALGGIRLVENLSISLAYLRSRLIKRSELLCTSVRDG